jgi:hypothetical protein
VLVSSNSIIDGMGKGYAGGRGYVAGRGDGAGGGYNHFTLSNFGGGAGYGGLGGYEVGSAQRFPGPVYGSYAVPADFGSGGGAGWGDEHGQDGGGYIKIQAQRVQVYGLITADSLTNRNGFDGGGSGGSVHIVAGVLEGNGAIRANGGPGRSAGGGGRVAIYYDEMSGYSGVLSARGGLGDDAAGNGGAGTVYLKRSSEANGELIIDNGDMVTTGWSTPLLVDGLLRLQSCTILGNARVSTAAGVRISRGNAAQFSSLISGGYLQVGGLLVSNTWVYGDVIEPVMSRSNGVPVVTVYCRPQKTYWLLATTNFLDWSAVATFTPAGSSFTFADTNAPSFGRRFFRAVMVDYLYDSIGISFNRTNQQARVNVNGAQPNHTLVLQASDNLRNWSPIATAIPSAVTNWQFLDTNAPSFQKRFYRAVGQGR